MFLKTTDHSIRSAIAASPHFPTLTPDMVFVHCTIYWQTNYHQLRAYDFACRLSNIYPSSLSARTEEQSLHRDSISPIMEFMENSKFTSAMACIEKIADSNDQKANRVLQSGIRHVPIATILLWDEKQRALIECDAPKGDSKSVSEYVVAL